MNKSLIYIVGATVLLGGGAYLFLKNKKAKDLAELDKLGGTTSGGTTTGGTTTGGTKPPLSTTSDGVSPSDANINLANATILATERKTIMAQPIRLSNPPHIKEAKLKIVDKKLADLGYKVDAIGQLVKI